MIENDNFSYSKTHEEGVCLHKIRPNFKLLQRQRESERERGERRKENLPQQCGGNREEELRGRGLGMG